MSGRCLRSGRPSGKGEEPIECLVNLSVQQLNHGDVLWSRFNGKSWWPVQVADEKCAPFKPKKMKKDQILVRLYGTFEHIYVDPANCVLKIETIFDQENSREVFQKFLEEDLTLMKSGGGASVVVVPESKEISEMEKDNEAPEGRRQIKRKLKRALTADNSLFDGSSGNIPKPAKQAKVATSKAIVAVKASEVGTTKRKTTRGVFKARNQGTGGIEAAKETAILNVGASTIRSSDDRDSSGSQREDVKGKLTLNVLHKASESNFLKQDCGRNPDVNNKIEISDAKDIKKLVAKIVKEVAEKARNEELKDKWMKLCPATKEASKIENMKRHILITATNNDVEAKINDVEVKNNSAIDDTCFEIAGPSEDKPSNGSSRDKIQLFGCEDDVRTKYIDVKFLSAAKGERNETREINGAHRSKDYLKVEGGKRSQSKFVKRDDETKSSELNVAMNGGQRGEAVGKDVSSEKMGSPNGTTECLMSPRRMRVMQSLGLIAPSGSPFGRNGLIRFSAAMNSQT